MGSHAHALSSSLAILAGGLFLVLPVAFLAGTISIAYSIGWESPLPPPPNFKILISMPNDMAFFLVFPGVVAVLAGFLALRLDRRPRIGVGLGFGFCLGLITFLCGTAIVRLNETFFTSPLVFLAFPEIAVALMAGATVVFAYEFLKARLSLPLTRAEARHLSMT